MRKICAVFILLVIGFGLQAQDGIKEFKLSIPKTTVTNSLYNKIEYIDSRINKDDLGYVPRSAFKDFRVLKDEIPLKIQIDSLFHSIIDTTAQDRTIVIQLRNLHFREIKKKVGRTGFCHIRINSYFVKDDLYYLIGTLDTLIIAESGNITNSLIKQASETITSYLSNTLTQYWKEERSYTMADVLNMSNLEKENLALYNVDKYKDGIYLDFRSFANQTPEEYEIVSQINAYNILEEVKTIDKNTKKKKKVKPKDIYAVVVGGQPYISTKKGYIIVFKKNDEFVFYNNGSLNTNARSMIITGILMGGLGAVFLSHYDVERVELIIDHLSGNFRMSTEKGGYNKRR